MNLFEFTNRVVDNGILAVKKDYKDSPEQLKGALAGFEACRGKNPGELQMLLNRASRDVMEAFHRSESGNGGNNYWEFKCKHAEIEWVCNLVSAVLAKNGMPVIVHPTCGGFMMANRVIGSEGCVILQGPEEREPYPESEMVMQGEGTVVQWHSNSGV